MLKIINYGGVVVFKCLTKVVRMIIYVEFDYFKGGQMYIHPMPIVPSTSSLVLHTTAIGHVLAEPKNASRPTLGA